MFDHDLKFSVCCLVFMLPLFLACQRQPESGKASISAQFDAAWGEKILLEEMDPTGLRRIDSANFGADGRVSFTVSLKEPAFYLLSSGTKGVLVLLLQPGENTVITGRWPDFPKKMLIKGSPGSKTLLEFFNYSSCNKERLDSLGSILVEKQDDDDFYQVSRVLDPQFNAIYEDQRRYQKAFIDNHLQSLAALIALNYAFGLHPVLTLKDDPDYYRKVDSSLVKAYPGNKHVVFHHQRMVEFQQEAK